MILLFMLFWVILNGRLEIDVLLTGAGVTAVMFAAVCLWGGWSIKNEIRCLLLIPRGIKYFFSLVVEIVKANLNVIKLIFSKTQPEPCLRSCRTPLKSAAGRAMLANSITLTPGTVTVQLTEDALLVHCLDKSLADGLDGWELEKQLLDMEKAVAKPEENKR